MSGVWFPVALVVVLVGAGFAWRWLGPDVDEAPPDWEALHLEKFTRFAHHCDHLHCQAHNDQAQKAFADHLTAMGVDLDDPRQLHAVMAGLASATGQALVSPFSAGPSLASHLKVLAARIPEAARD